MKRLLSFLFGVLLFGMANKTFICPAYGDTYSDEGDTAYVVAADKYSFYLRLKVPQVLDNTKSLGYRKYQAQAIKGTLYIKWLSDGSYSVSLENLVNNKFKVGGRAVTYTTDNANFIFPRMNWIGSNKSGEFNTPTLAFSSVLEPSYAIGAADEDNSFYLLFSGKGSSKKKKGTGGRVATTLKGYVAGTQGCSCFAYGHISPTRVGSMCGPSDRVDDAVAAFGTWSAKWEKRLTCSGTIICK